MVMAFGDRAPRQVPAILQMGLSVCKWPAATMSTRPKADAAAAVE